jgi:hypothetical protein
MPLSNLCRIQIKEQHVIHRMRALKVSSYLICSEQLINYRYLSEQKCIVGTCLQCVKHVSVIYEYVTVIEPFSQLLLGD